MAKPENNPPKIVVLSGAGLSAPSGLKTFRDSGGLWEQYRLEDVATLEAWERQPEVVLDFYNQRRTQMCAASPNAGHRAIAELEQFFEVIVITQNIDDLHERAGSTQVIHVHGELTKARSTADASLVYEIGNRPIHFGDHCALGSQLRPHIVWFGEDVMRLAEAQVRFLLADRVLVVGTSLTVFPAAGLVDYAASAAEKVLVDLDTTSGPPDFRLMRGSTDVILPTLVQEWCQKR